MLSREEITALAEKHGLPPEIALAIYEQESKSGKDVRESPKGAKGGFQLMPATFKSMGGTDIDDPLDNAEAGIKYLAEGYKKTGTIEGTAAYYHAGPEFKRKMAENPELSDGAITTRDYSRKVAQKANALKATREAMDPIIDFSNVTSGPTDVPGRGTEPSLSGDATVVTAKKLPNVMDAMADLLKDAEQIGATLVSTSKDLVAKDKENLAKAAASARRQGELAATMELEAFRLQQVKANENAEHLTQLGVNRSDTDSIIARISTEMAADFEEAQALRVQINESKARGGVDILNPMGSIMNVMERNANIREHNAKIDAIASKKRYVEQATSVAGSVAAANALKYTSVTAEGAKAAAELKQEIANFQAMQIEEKLTRSDFNAQLQTLQAINSRIGTLNAYNTALEGSKVKTEQEEAKKTKEEAAKLEDQRIQIAGRVLGMEITSRKDLDKQTPEIKAAVERVLASGTDGQIAKNPLEASEVLARGNLNRMPASLAQMARSLTAVRKETEVEVANDKMLQTKEQRINALNERMARKFNEYVQRPDKPFITIGPGERINPFGAPGLEVMAKDPNTKDLKLIKILQTHAINLPQVQLTENLIKELAFSNVGAGKPYADITEAARDISTYFKAAVIRNNVVFRLEALGLNPQSAYIIGGKDFSSYPVVMKMLLENRQRQATYTPTKEQQAAQRGTPGVGNAGSFGNFQEGQN